ncbi:GNAT family N-acetyltransferase [Adhaeribacter soli]|uniref:GNAT family N-acetyltransferase n=1 Tax=Adhaeribacter soli TaxID=2607655 RepID=A0A5N1J994_9BACT|nr:GNAT family N-acetyltransferase [Adhaeribacter soli]KAA9345548.1 GNAT family N-acetyltransferase [Adhaeribacter soli]
MLEINLNPFTELQTDRLILRQVRESDAPEILFLRSDDAVMKYLDREKMESLNEARQLIQDALISVKKNEGIMWAICLRGTDFLIGTIGHWRFDKAHHRSEIGYTIRPAFWGQGLMSEAMQAVLDYGFNQLHLHSVEANVNPNNQASIKLLEKHGFVKEAHFKENYYFRGRFLDSAIYSLLKPKR